MKQSKKKQARQWKAIQHFFNDYPVDIAMAMLWKMLKFSLGKNDKAITEKERSRLISFYHGCQQLLENCYGLTKGRKK